MIKDPWPLYWTPFTTDIPKRIRFRWYCRFSRRYTLPCATSRRKCMGCYMRQQHISDKTNIYNRKHGEEYVIHLCDRCGAVIPEIDKIIYNEITNRDGGTLASLELCASCTSQLDLWIHGAGINLDDRIWGDDEETP